MASPVILTISIIIKFRDNGPVFYRGVRLGFQKKPFFMYKFRTLPIGIQNELGDRLFSEKIRRIDSFSKFLRDTRLDELPQLFNVLKGDMDFVGPRPERPEISEKVGTSIPNYEFRYSVRPGLIGFSQLFTPHSSPKRLRALIDNRYICTKRSLTWDIVIIVLTFSVLAKEVLVRGVGLFYRYVVLGKIFGRFSEKRAYERITQEYTEMCFIDDGGNHGSKTSVIDINEGYFKIMLEHRLVEKDLQAVFWAHFKRKNRSKVKVIRVNAQVYKSFKLLDAAAPYVYVMEYSPATRFNEYLVDKYLLKKSII